eukprot:363950-Chlamydomonas_euryale.AAC.12
MFIHQVACLVSQVPHHAARAQPHAARVARLVRYAPCQMPGGAQSHAACSTANAVGACPMRLWRQTISPDGEVSDP